MIDFTGESELEKDFASAVKTFHNMDLKEILGIGLVTWREIGEGKIGV
jgi:hypothetical protein